VKPIFVKHKPRDTYTVALSPPTPKGEFIKIIILGIEGLLLEIGEEVK
jgi:hypothetical protein